jgi:hypothetical protein
VKIPSLFRAGPPGAASAYDADTRGATTAKQFDTVGNLLTITHAPVS